MHAPSDLIEPKFLSPYRILFYSANSAKWDYLLLRLRQLGIEVELTYELVNPADLPPNTNQVYLIDSSEGDFDFDWLNQFTNFPQKSKFDVWVIAEAGDVLELLPYVRSAQITGHVLASTAVEELEIYLERRYAIQFQQKTSEIFARLQASLVQTPDEPHLKKQIAKILTSQFKYSGVMFHSLNYAKGAVDVFTGWANGVEIEGVAQDINYCRGLTDEFFQGIFANAPRSSILIQDLVSFPSYPFPELINRFKWKSLIAIPLYIKQDIHAVMVVLTDFYHQFDQKWGIREERMLTEFANLAATDHYNWRQFKKFEEIETSAQNLAQFVSSRTVAINNISNDLLNISEAQGASICYFEAMHQNVDPTRQQFVGDLGRGILDWSEISSENPGELARLWRQILFSFLNSRDALRILVPEFRSAAIDLLNLDDFTAEAAIALRPMLKKLTSKLYDSGIRSMIVRCLRGRDSEPVGFTVFFYSYKHAYANPDSDHEYKKSLGVFLSLAAVTLDRAKSSMRKKQEDQFFQEFIQGASPASFTEGVTEQTWDDTLTHIMEITGASRAIVGFQDEWGINEFRRELPEAKKFPEKYLDARILGDTDTPERWAFENNTTVSVRDANTSERWEDLDGMRSLMVVPITRGEETDDVIGVFSLGCEKPNVFDHPDKEFLKKLARLLGIEIEKENVDLSGRISIPAQTRFLVEATRKFAPIKPIREELRKKIEEFRRVNDFDLVSFHLYDPEWAKFDWYILSGNKSEDVLVFTPVAQQWLTSSSGTCFEIKQLSRAEQLSWLTSFFVEKERLNESFAVKICSGSRPLGMLMLHQKGRKVLSPIEIAKIEIFAEEVLEITKKADLLPDLAEYLRERLALDNVSFHLYQARDKSFAAPIRAGVDLRTQDMSIKPYAAAERVMASLASEMFVPDADRTHIFSGGFVRREGFRSAGYVKLLDQNETLGVLFVNRRRGNRWHTREKEIIQIFAQIAAVTLQNRRQLRAIKQSDLETAAIMQASRRIIQSGFQQNEISNVLLRQAVQITGASFATMRHVNGNRLGSAAVWGLSREEEKQWQADFGKLQIFDESGKNNFMVTEFLIQARENPNANHVYIQDVSERQSYKNTSRKEVASALVFAIRNPTNDEPVGILNLEHQLPNGFDPKTIKLLAQLIDQASTAFYTARRISQSQRIETLTWRGLFGSNWWHTVAQKTLAMKTDLAILKRLIDQPTPEVLDQIEQFNQTLIAINSIPSRGFLPENMEQDPEPIHIYGRLKEIVRGLTKDEQGILIEYKLGEHKPEVAIHEPMFELAMEKLIMNAVQAMNHTGRIIFRDHSTEKYLIFDIEDSGPGIPDEHLELFLNERIDSDQFAKGSGVGALMAKFVFERYSGELALSGSSEKGTILTAKLPLYYLDEGEEEEKANDE